MKASATVPCLLLVLVIAGCPQNETPVIAEPPAGQPPEEPMPAEPGPAEAPETVVRFAWLSTDGKLMLLDADAMEATPADIDVSPGEQISWSEDGSVVAAMGSDDQVYRIDLKTGESVEVGPPTTAFMRTFVVSPDGTRVAQLRDDVISVWADGETTEIAGPRSCNVPSWSVDSQRLAIGAMGEEEESDGGLWIWDGEGDATQVVPAADGWGCTCEIMWSPDGQMLAWARGAGDGWTGDLARADGSGLRRDVIGAGPIAWLPDGSGLLVSVHIEAGAFGAGIYRLADGTLARIGDEEWGGHAALSPDGARVLAWGYDGRALMVDVATDEARTWREDLHITQAAWAPDGRLALVIGGNDEASQLWIGDADGTEAGRIPVEADWRWDGRWIELPADAAVLP